MARKGQFKKGGGRVGSGSSTKSRALTRYKTRTIVRTVRARPAAPRKRRGRARGRAGRGGGVKLLHLAIAAAGVSYLTSEQGPAFIRTNVAKIPGAKTFGAPAIAGMACLAVDHFKPNKWLRLAGYTGLVLAAAKVGTAGKTFKWVGDADEVQDVAGDYDLADDISDVGDDDISDVGDDDMGDDEE